MTLNFLTMIVGFAVLVFWPISREKIIRNSARSLAAVVFSIGLVSLMSKLILPLA